jgi:glycosyltransferase involved in cell wall biosynthesis
VSGTSGGARVLWLTKGLGLGGAERLLTSMAPRFAGGRFAVDVAYVVPWKDAFVPDLERVGVRTVCLGGGRTIELLWPRRLWRLVRDGRYDVVHTHSPVPAVVARVAVPATTRVVHTEHNLWDRYRWPTAAANALTYARNDAVLAVSDGVAASIVRPRWARVGRMPPVATLLHGVDPGSVARGAAARASARRNLDLPEATPVVGCVANFTPKKDHVGLIAAAEEVRQAVPDVVLLLVGSGPLEAELRELVSSRGLDGTVRFLGSRPDVLELLPGLDLFVLGSRFEGLPISLLEAMAAEVPVVATTVGGVPEAVTHGVEGMLVPPAQPHELAGAITELLHDPARRRELGAAAASRVEAEFSIDRAVRRTEELYERLLRGRDDAEG